MAGGGAGLSQGTVLPCLEGRTPATKEDAMKIFVAGATGVLGRRLVPLLIANGHTVVGTTHTPSKADTLRAVGATPVVLDALDREAVIDAVGRAEPEVVVHELTALASFTDFRKLEESFA